MVWPTAARFVTALKAFPNGEVSTMLIPKSCRMLFGLAAASAMAQVSYAGCNCSVPPSPAVSSGMVAPVPWAGMPAYGNSPGSMSATAYGTLPQSFGDYDSAGPHWAPGGYEA